MPALVEGGLTIAREVGIAYATGGASLACGTGRLMATGMALVRTTLVAREAYQAYENTAAAYQDFKEGNYASGLYHSTLAALNVAGVKSGLGRLKNDLHLAAFPNAHCFQRERRSRRSLGCDPSSRSSATTVFGLSI